MLVSVVSLLTLLALLFAPGDLRAASYDKKLEFKKAGILQCVNVDQQAALYGHRYQAPYPTPDWNDGVYSLLEDQTKRIYDLVKANSKEMNIQNLYSEGLPVDMKNYSTDVELVVYERGGLSPETVQAVNGIEGDEVVLNWLRDNPREDWSALSDNIKPIPRKRPVDGKLRVAFVFGEHSRELVSTEMGEFFLKVLAESSTETLLPLLNGDSKLVKEVLEALDNTVIHAVPCENKNGRRIVETPDPNNGKAYLTSDPNLCHRVNARIADPNRNWPAKGGVLPSDYKKATEDGPGASPLSEPESRLIFRIMHAVEPQAVVNIHSGMFGMFMPPDYTPIMVNSADSLAQLRLQQYLNDKWLDGKCSTGGGGHSVGYVAYGTTNDFLRLGFQIPSTQTWEIFGNQKAEYYDCFSLLNPIGEAQLNEYLTRWTRLALEHISLLYKGLVPGIRSPEGVFSEEVAKLPNPNACGLTRNHIDAMDGLSDIALGRGDRSERLRFVEEAMRTTPTLILPELPNENLQHMTSSAGFQQMEGTKTAGSLEGRKLPRDEGKDGNSISNRVEPKGASFLMMRSSTIMLFGLLLLAVALVVFRKQQRRRASKPRRRYKVWDVV